MVDARSGNELYSKNADRRRAVASTQKLLTALVILDSGGLDRRLTVARTDTYVEPTKLYIRPGESYTRGSLLTALLVRSGNDVARALARDNAGGSDAFARRMNAKARSLGMRDSNFLNPHGLTEKGQFSTARDMARLALQAYRDPEIRSRVGIRRYTFRFAGGRTKTLENTNKVLLRFPYCNGMKTGYTRASGYCLISSANAGSRHVIAVLLGSPRATWDDTEAILRWALTR